MVRASVLSRLICLVALVALVQADNNHTEQTNKDSALRSYQAIKEGIKKNKQEMCSFLLADIGNQNEVLDLAKVTFLFESALDHLAKTTEYVTLMRPHVDERVVRNFDEQGGHYVLEISQARVRVIEEYGEAKRLGASELERQTLLEKYFYKACEFKLSTIVAEKAMYESALKAERTLQIKLFPAEEEEEEGSQ